MNWEEKFWTGSWVARTHLWNCLALVISHLPELIILLTLIFTFLSRCPPIQSRCTVHEGSKWWTSRPRRWRSAGSRWATMWPAATATTWRCSTAPRWAGRRRPGRRCATTPRAATLSTPFTTWRHLPTWVSNWSYVIQKESWRVRSSRFRLTRMVSVTLAELQPNNHP